MKTYLAFFSLLLLGFFISGSAGGEEKEAIKQGLAQPCQEDLQKFCKGLPRNYHDKMICLEEKENELTYACRQNLSSWKSDVDQAESACQNDLDKYCSTVAPGRGAWFDCLRANQSKLSSVCQSSLNKLRARKE